MGGHEARVAARPAQVPHGPRAALRHHRLWGGRLSLRTHPPLGADTGRAAVERTASRAEQRRGTTHGTDDG